jgi:hypothetical protein
MHSLPKCPVAQPKCLKLRQAERRLFRSAGLAGSGGNCRVVRRTALRSFLTFCFLLCQDKRKSCRRQKCLRRHAFLFRGKRKGGKKTLNRYSISSPIKVHFAEIGKTCPVRNVNVYVPDFEQFPISRSIAQNGSR